jgi:membrane-associated phospholipid phosphatase
MRDPQQRKEKKSTFVPLMPTNLRKHMAKLYEKLHHFDVLYTNKIYTTTQQYTPLRILSKAIGIISDAAALPLFVFIYWITNKPHSYLFIGYTIALLFIQEFIIKEYFHRSRPKTAKGKKGLSFPSTHSFASGFASVIALALSMPYAQYILGFAVLNAANRPALGVHYIADVCAGIALGMFTAFGWIALIGIF